ncbi:hypothetical protein [Leucobacter triazinivorans]|uniref:hypothetical protein n=1 Tax=Leucobacter triazinivorans TaxID=1784719 RepID=UPI0013EE7CA8|nr:hypothetical protein [Leucobacter triazinivorans]
MFKRFGIGAVIVALLSFGAVSAQAATFSNVKLSVYDGRTLVGSATTKLTHGYFSTSRKNQHTAQFDLVDKRSNKRAVYGKVSGSYTTLTWVKMPGNGKSPKYATIGTGTASTAKTQGKKRLTASTSWKPKPHYRINSTVKMCESIPWWPDTCGTGITKNTRV